MKYHLKSAVFGLDFNFILDQEQLIQHYKEVNNLLVLSSSRLIELEGSKNSFFHALIHLISTYLILHSASSIISKMKFFVIRHSNSVSTC